MKSDEEIIREVRGDLAMFTSPRRTKSGVIDKRTRAYREGRLTPDPHETEQMLRLIYPAAHAAGKRVEDAMARVRAFREQHPELAEMEREVGDAITANNVAFFPMNGLLFKLSEAGAHDRFHAWRDFLNGKTEVMP